MSEEEQKAPTKEQVVETLKRIRAGIRITKITTTRSVKTSRGDSFVGFSAAWQSVQDDHGGAGADLVPSEQDEKTFASQGLTIKDAKIARHMLAMECDIAALESAVANGSISSEYFRDAAAGIRNNYNRLVLSELGIQQHDE